MNRVCPWSFYDNAAIAVGHSLSITVTFRILCLLIVRSMFKTGNRLQT